MACTLPVGQPHYFADVAVWRRKGRKRRKEGKREEREREKRRRRRKEMRGDRRGEERKGGSRMSRNVIVGKEHQL